MARLAMYTPSFTHTGVDYFGPLYVAVGRRIEKRWGCLFTCLSTSAIHIEIAHNLDVNSFVLCYRNLLNRRGTVRHLYSDRGTNFVGSEKIAEILTDPSITWHFNPPHAPHMGGAWERLVRSVKRALMEALPQRNPTDEILRSALIEVEALVNSRPLTYVPIDSNQANALTPNDFLGIHTVVDANHVPDDSPETLINNYKTSLVIANKFWRRWVTEYLPELTRRSKWFEETPELKQGDLVIVVDPNSKRGEWPKGIVEAVKRSKDGRVRSAEVRTIHGIKNRPASKLAPLLIKQSWTSDTHHPLEGTVKSRSSTTPIPHSTN